MPRPGKFPRSSKASPNRAFSMGPAAPIPLSRPIPLAGGHDLSAFDCGVPALNGCLPEMRLVNQQNLSARTYVACRGETVVGYYTEAAESSRAETPRTGWQQLAPACKGSLFCCWPAWRSRSLRTGQR